MRDQNHDLLRQFQTLTQQSWDTWLRQMPQAGMGIPTTSPASASGHAAIERTLSGLKTYLEWMQNAANGTGGAAGDWQQQIQQWMTGAAPPFSQAFAGIDSTDAQGFARQWQNWMQAASAFPSGLPLSMGAPSVTPAFGLNREQQMQQQALAAAMAEALQAMSNYQTLIHRANAQGMQHLQDKLAQHAEPGRQIDSLKAFYDLWVDAMEEAYADIALSDEFRQAYAEMVNTQMRVRHMQQQQTEEICRQLGMPTRAEVSSLGERLQAVRRELAALRHAQGESVDTATVSEAKPERRNAPAKKRKIPAAATPAKTAARGKAKKAAPVSKAKTAGNARASRATASRKRGKR